ncbi:MAG: hypothetical protein MI755_14585 [Sphingomonadales bacterium]|nr:hypothetical protein [Sphingomonadales bacterium]
MRLPTKSAGLAALFLLSNGNLVAEEAQIKVLYFAGKEKSIAAIEMGEAVSCEVYEFAINAEKCFYPKGNEITFVDGKADWIFATTNGLNGDRSVADMLRDVGLKPFERPDWSRGSSGARWENAKFDSTSDTEIKRARFREVNVFPNSGYVYINVFSTP